MARKAVIGGNNFLSEKELLWKMIEKERGKMSKKSAGLKRPRYPVPEFVRTALEDRNLMGAYFQRPAYQQNDYVGWITRAKMAATQRKRLEQMLDELFRGDVYMKMAYRPKNRQK